VAEPAASRVEVFATPASLPSGGGIAQILGIAYDGSGNRLPSVQMSFSTTTGTLSSNTITTDGAGEARVLLTTTLEATVTATVVTAGDKAVTGTVKVTLRSAPTVGIVVGTATPTAGQPVSFTFNVTTGTGGAAVRTAVVTFGDGSSQTLSTTGTTVVSHTYAQAGSYTVTATATDAAGETGVATAGVSVAEATPLSVIITPSGGTTTKSSIIFTATVKPDTALVARYEWDFGDGGTRITPGNVTTHVYDSIGRKVVRVRVVLTDGRSATAEIEIYLAT
jgi:PKD repeat protein